MHPKESRDRSGHMSDECCYCGDPAATRDHVPTRKLFPSPRPSDLITVPSCMPCNTRLSIEEEYFIHVLILLREADTAVVHKLREQRFSQDPTPRQVRMAHRMLSSMYTKEIQTPGGLYLGSGTAFTIDQKQFDEVVEKIARGLYFTEFAQRPPKECVAQVRLKPPREVLENPDVTRLISEGRGRAVGGDAFAYRIVRALEIPSLAFCFMLFFGSIPVICSFQPATTSAADSGS